MALWLGNERVVLGTHHWAGFVGMKALVNPSCDSAAGENREMALNILKKRYAGGEIGDEEFERKKQHLQ